MYAELQALVVLWKVDMMSPWVLITYQDNDEDDEDEVSGASDDAATDVRAACAFQHIPICVQWLGLHPSVGSFLDVSF